jgi:hypothetical protein
MRRIIAAIVAAVATACAVVNISLFVSLTGCGLSAVQVKERTLCYQHADAAAQKRVDQECGDSFQTCLAAHDILDELRAAQEACK